MIHLISILRFILMFGALFVFPPLVVYSARTRGHKRVWMLTAGAFALIALYALAAASPAFGNVRAATDGYGRMARATGMLFGLTLGCPVLFAVLTTMVPGTARLPLWAVCAIAIGASALGCVAGILASLALISRL